MYSSRKVWTSNNIRNGEITDISCACGYNSTALVFESMRRNVLSFFRVTGYRSVITNNISLSSDSDDAKNYCMSDTSKTQETRGNEQTSTSPVLSVISEAENNALKIVRIKLDVNKKTIIFSTFRYPMMKNCCLL